MKIEHTKDISISSIEDLLIRPHLYGLFDELLGLSESLHAAILTQGNTLSLSKVDLRDLIRKRQPIIDDCLGKRVMIEVYESSCHIEIDLNQQGLSHIDIWVFSELLPVKVSNIVIVVDNEEFFVFISQITKAVVLGLLLAERNLYLRT
jgi:hypothetical protein